jgi:hypothetical protein
MVCGLIGRSDFLLMDKTNILPCAIAALILTLGGTRTTRADTLRTQTINLQKGWNSVFLQVSPSSRDPGAVFANTPVEIVATYFAVDRAVQYIQNPGSIGWNKDGWAVWYAPSRSDAFLSSLHAVHGNRAFLIFSKQDFTWTVTGAAAFEPIRWKGNSFNLLGLGIDPASPPTFDQFFGPSAAHQPYRIYRLVNGQWMLVANPVSTPINSGEAYWIYCRGGSDYQGPLRARILVGEQIDFGTTSDSWITFANESTDPINIQVQTVASDVGLPLGYTIRGISQGAMVPVTVPLPASYAIPVLEAGDNTSLFLTLRRQELINPLQSALLKVTTDNGVQLWVPVTASQTDQTAVQKKSFNNPTNSFNASAL